MVTKFVAWGQRVTRADSPQPPGNSLAIVDLAFELGYDAVEIDLRITKDRRLALMHDPTIDKTTHGTGRVSQYTLDELRSIQLRDQWNGEPAYIASFADALRVCARRGPVMCDLRRLDRPTLDALEADIAETGHPQEELIFIPYSLDHAVMLRDRFEGAVILLKAPPGAMSPELGQELVRQAVGFDGVMLPIAQMPDEIQRFRAMTNDLGLNLGVYIQHHGLPALLNILHLGVDYVTSVSHQHFKAAREKFSQDRELEGSSD